MRYKLLNSILQQYICLWRYLNSMSLSNHRLLFRFAEWLKAIFRNTLLKSCQNIPPNEIIQGLATHLGLKGEKGGDNKETVFSTTLKHMIIIFIGNRQSWSISLGKPTWKVVTKFSTFKINIIIDTSALCNQLTVSDQSDSFLM